MKPFRIRLTTTPALTANNICTAQAATAGTPLVINGATAGVLATNQLTIGIASTVADPANKFLVKGTGLDGRAIVEAVWGPITAGASTAARTINAFKTITSITPLNNGTGNITVGWNAVFAASQLVPVDPLTMNGLGINLRASFTPGSTGTVTCQYTTAKPMTRRGFPGAGTLPPNANWAGTEFDLVHGLRDPDSFTNSLASAISANYVGLLEVPITALRVTVVVAIVGEINLEFVQGGKHGGW